MVTRVLLTGGTGYIGGTVLDTVIKQHPEYDVSVLLRNVPPHFQELYPHIHIVHGDYDSSDIISDAASKADIVVHNGNSDHEPSINAIISGLLRRDPRSPPGFLIHLSGTGIVADWLEGTYLGRLNPKIWSDVHDLDAITTRPDRELHRNVDKIIQAAASAHGDRLKTAIICPPDIYGPGRGPGRKESVFFPAFWKEIKEVGAPFYAGEGKNTRSWVHIEDLMTIYLKLIEAAAAGGGGADWGREGYYFAGSQERSQLDVAKAAGPILQSHGLIDHAEPIGIALEKVDGMLSSLGYPHIGTYMFAANSRTRADRAAKLFGYQPRAPSIFDSLEADLLIAAQK